MRGILLGLGAAVAVGGAAVIVGTQMAAPKPPPSREQLLADLKTHIGAQLGATAAASVGFAMAEGIAKSLDPTPPEGAVSEREEAVPADESQPAGTRKVKIMRMVAIAGQRATINVDVQIAETRGPNRLNMRARANYDLNICPDTDGKVIALVDVNSSGDTSVDNAAGTGGASTNFSIKGKVTGMVGDAATLVSLANDLSGEATVRAGAKLTTSGKKTTSSVGGGYMIKSAWSVDSKPDASGAVNSEIGDLKDSDLRLSKNADAKFTQDVALFLAVEVNNTSRDIFELAQAKWRNGFCVEVNAAPPAKPDGTKKTQPKEALTFKASVRHKFDAVELSAPIEVSLSGEKSVSPDKIDRAPGDVRYTAGEAKDASGAVLLKTTSRRGIAERTVRFSNKPQGYRFEASVGPYFKIDDIVCDIEQPFSVNPKGEFSGVTVRFTPRGRDGGTFTQSGRAYGVNWSGGGPYTIAWTGEESGRFTGQDNNTATAPIGQSDNQDIMTGSLTALAGEECSAR